MPRRKIRTSSGRLTARERRIRTASARPGETVLIDASRRHAKGRRLRSGMQVEFVAATQWAVDLDVRNLVHRIRVALAVHFRDALLAGKRPTGGDLPKVDPETVARAAALGRKRPDVYGLDSGWMARHWIIGPIRGSSQRAQTWLKPNGHLGRAKMIDRALREGVDFQGVTGDAAQVIQDATDAWLRDAVPSRSDGVRTDPEVPTKGGELPEFL